MAIKAFYRAHQKLFQRHVFGIYTIASSLTLTCSQLILFQSFCHIFQHNNFFLRNHHKPHNYSGQINYCNQIDNSKGGHHHQHFHQKYQHPVSLDIFKSMTKRKISNQSDDNIPVRRSSRLKTMKEKEQKEGMKQVNKKEIVMKKDQTREKRKAATRNSKKGSKTSKPCKITHVSPKITTTTNLKETYPLKEINNDVQDRSKKTEDKKSMIKKKNVIESKDTSSSAQISPCLGNKIHDPSLLLLDLGTLVKGKLIKRPSSKIRSPYVADVKLLMDENDECLHEEEQNSENNDTMIVQAHSPALDVGGLCSNGAVVYMSKRAPGGKTSHSIELVLAPGPRGEKNDDYVLVGCHPSLGEKLAEEVLKRGLLQEYLGFGPAELKKNTSTKKVSSKKKTEKKKKKGGKATKIVESDESPSNQDDAQQNDEDTTTNKTVLYRQRTYGDSRVDFELINSSTPKCDDESSAETKRALIEVKNVVCSDYCGEHAPSKTGPNHCVIIAPETKHHKENDAEAMVKIESTSKVPQSYKRSGIFPWGRVGQTFEGQKVVSERAIKHLRNLSKLNNNSESNKGKVQTVVLFVINRSDCESMRACHEACPVFAKELKSTSDNGTIVLSFGIHWTESGKAFFDGIIPVSL